MQVKRGYLSVAGVMMLGVSAVAQTTIPDAQIEANVLKSLAGAPQLANENITSNTVYGVVTLSGTVKDEPMRAMAENLTARASGVKKVVDELGIGAVQAGNANGNGTPDANATNPMLQSDGTMAPPPAGQPQHAPEPDVYAAQQAQQDQSGMNSAPQQAGTQPGASQDGGYTPPPMTRRQPYNGQQPYPQNGQDRADNVRPPYQPGVQPLGGPQRLAPPPPYGAQEAGKPVTVPPGSLLRVRINEGLDSKHTQPGAAFDAVVLNDVVADGVVAIPRGAAVQGQVTQAKSGGAIRGHGELSLQLTQVTLGGKVYPMTSDVWQRDSSDKGAQTVGNAVGLGAAGAIIGAIAGGGGGAAIGAVAGGAAGVGTSAASGGRQVVVPSEAILTFHMAQPASLMTISQAEMDRLGYGVPIGAQQGGQQMVRRRYPQPYYGGPGYPPPPGYPQPY